MTTNTNPEFITKEDYLSKRAFWKRDYMNLATHITMMKRLTVEASSGGYSAARRLQSARALMSNDAHGKMVYLNDLKDRARFSVDSISGKILRPKNTY
jgi:hypothetical protein